MESVADLRQMSDEQLRLTWKDAAETLFRLRLQKATERLDVPTELKKNRRLIARCQTLLNQRLQAAGAAAVAK